jgi:hypothetical protein
MQLGLGHRQAVQLFEFDPQLLAPLAQPAETSGVSLTCRINGALAHTSGSNQTGRFGAMDR